MDKNKGTKKERSVLRWVLSLMFTVAAAALITYPFLDTLTGFSQRRMISSSLAAQAAVSDDELEAEIEKSITYNAQVYADQQMGKYGYLGSQASDDTYDSLWQLDSQGTICTVSVPSVSIRLPVLHGTDSDELQYAAGHMYGSSLPVGGENTKAVIAAHTGLSNASLFTDLDRVKEGETIYIQIGKQVHGYRITSIDVYAKGTEKEGCKIADGEDQVVLYTCTPRGINDHRLLITGTRDTSLDYVDDKVDAGESLDVRHTDLLSGIRLIALLLIPAAVFLLCFFKVFKPEQKQDLAEKTGNG